MTASEQINQIMALCKKKGIPCKLKKDSFNYADAYISFGNDIYEKLLVYIESGNGAPLKKQITELTEVWSKLCKIKKIDDRKKLQERYKAIVDKGEEIMKNYENQAVNSVKEYIEKTQGIYIELLTDSTYKKFVERNPNLKDEAVKLFETILAELEKVVDGNSQKAMELYKDVCLKIKEFRASVMGKNGYINNRLLKETCDMIKEWASLEPNDKKCRRHDELSQEVSKIINDKKEPFRMFRNFSELKQRCAQLFADFEDKDKNPLEQLEKEQKMLDELTDKLTRAQEEQASIQNEFMVKYNNSTDMQKKTLQLVYKPKLSVAKTKIDAIIKEIADASKRCESTIVRSNVTAIDKKLGEIRQYYVLNVDTDILSFIGLFGFLMNPIKGSSNRLIDVLSLMMSPGGIRTLKDEETTQILGWLTNAVDILKQKSNPEEDIIEEITEFNEQNGEVELEDELLSGSIENDPLFAFLNEGKPTEAPITEAEDIIDYEDNDGHTN